MSQFIGAFHNNLFIFLMKDDGYSLGQKLAQIEKTANKKYSEATDKEIYEALQLVLKEDYSDEVYSDEEFGNWVAKH